MKRLLTVIFIVLLVILSALGFFFLTRQNTKTSQCGIFISDNSKIYDFSLKEPSKWEEYWHKYLNCENGFIEAIPPSQSLPSHFASIEFVLDESYKGDLEKKLHRGGEEKIIYSPILEDNGEKLKIIFRPEGFSSDEIEMLSVRTSAFINNIIVLMSLNDSERKKDDLTQWFRSGNNLSVIGLDIREEK